MMACLKPHGDSLWEPAYQCGSNIFVAGRRFSAENGDNLFASKQNDFRRLVIRLDESANPDARVQDAFPFHVAEVLHAFDNKSWAWVVFLNAADHGRVHLPPEHLDLVAWVRPGIE